LLTGASRMAALSRLKDEFVLLLVRNERVAVDFAPLIYQGIRDKYLLVFLVSSF
jgi:hypothetical protein